MTPTPVNPPAAAPAPPRWPKRNRRRWLALALLAALALVPPGGWLVHQWAERRDLEAVLAELDRTDPDWRWDRPQSRRPTYADHENSALQALKVLTAYGKQYFEIEQAERELFQDLPAVAQLNDRQLDVLRQRLGEAEKALAEAYKLKDMPAGRHPIRYSEDYVSTPWEPLMQTHSVSDLLYYDALLRTHDGDEAGTLRSCACMINVGRSVADEPSALMGALIRIDCTAHAIAAAERALAQGQPADESLKDLQTRFERELAEDVVRPGLRGERAGLDLFVRCVHAGNIAPSVLAGQPQRSTLWGHVQEYLPSTVSLSRAETLRMMNRIVATLDLPEGQQADAADAIQKEAAERGGVPWLAPNYGGIMALGNRHRARLRGAVVGLAAERYRLKHDRWPESLQELVKEGLLREVPRDPFDGGPLRWKRLPDGVVVYSVGPEKNDNGGNMRRARPHLPGTDLGFRLWDATARRQPPLPPLPPPDLEEKK